MAQLAISFEEYWQTCVSCGVWFGVDRSLDRSFRTNKTNFFCPNGHSQSYRENDADRLRKELEQERQQLQQERQRVQMERGMRQTAENQLKAIEAKHKRTLKRVNAGVCPHCNRTFQQLARHMQCKHKESQ